MVGKWTNEPCSGVDEVVNTFWVLTLARAVVIYHDHNPPPPQDQIPGSVYVLYDRVLYDGSFESSTFVYDTMYYHIFDIYKKFYGDRFIYLHV